MKKVELLCPAGNKEMLHAAVMNGADAVYIAGTKFGARKFAQNFNEEELINSIKFCHLYGVKVYVTINTLIKDNEVNEFISFVDFLHKNSVDAVLMQDLGMINLVRRMYPNLEIHASTQFHNHNNEGLKYLNSIGVKRAVLARELSIEEIRNLDCNIEKEIFVHGALCICYSGQCLMSSIVMNRSGNRGECAGMCRLPYKLVENDKEINLKNDYLISPKELCTIDKLKEILNLRIDSIKIEGRMKSTEYVACVTKLYRIMIDKYCNNEDMKVTEKELQELKVIYNRGFTHGKLFNKQNDEFINPITPNHIGINIGNVIDITNKKIKIKLDTELNQGDAIKFVNSNLGMYVNFMYDEKDNLINCGKINDIIYLDNKINLKNKDIVSKTIDKKLVEEVLSYPDKKINIIIRIIAKLNKKLEITFNDGINEIKEYGNTVEKATNSPTTKDSIKEKIVKLGNTPFFAENVIIDIDNNVFIPISEINNIRRILSEKLINIRENKESKYEKMVVTFKKDNIKLTNNLSVLIENEEDYKKDNKTIFYTNNKELYLKYKDNNNIFYRISRISNTNLNYNKELLLINDIGSVNKYKKNNKIFTDIYMNVTNSYTVKTLHELGIEKVGISPELSIEEINTLYDNFYNNFKYYPNIESFIFGKLELMIINHCILNMFVNKNKVCNVCKTNNKYYLKDRNNELYRIITNNCKDILLNYKTRNRINNIDKLKSNNYLISLIDIKDKKDIKKFIESRI